MPTAKVQFTFDDEDERIIDYMDMLRDAVLKSNNLGEGDWKWLANGFRPEVDQLGHFKEDPGAYYILDRLLKKVMLQFFQGNEAYAENLHELISDNGESIRYNLENNAIYVIYGVGHYFGGIWA